MSDLRLGETSDRTDDSLRRLLTIKEAADTLGCSETNIYSLIEAGELPVVAIGLRKGYRVDTQDIDAFILRRKQQKIVTPVKQPVSRPRLKHIRLS